MTLKQIYKKRNIEIRDSWKDDYGKRCGRIRKEVVMTAGDGWLSGGGKCTIGYTVDTNEETIEVVFLRGGCPNWRDMFDILLSDRDIRRLIKMYQQRSDVQYFRVFSKRGSTGREDLYISRGASCGGFSITSTNHRLHISMYGKLNEGFGRDGKMRIDDFTELAAFLGYTKDMSAKFLKRRSGARYIRPRLIEELDQFSTSPSQLL